MSWNYVEAEPNRITHVGERLTLMYGDYVNNGCRVMLADKYRTPVGMRQKYAMTFRVPAGWPIDHPVAFSHIISQWRQEGSPTIALEIIGNEWVVGSQCVAPVVPNAEINFLFDIRFALEADGGFATCCVDGEQVLDYKGDTIKPVSTEIAWSIGIYRPWWQSNPLEPGEPSYRVLDVIYAEQLAGKGGPCDRG